MANCSLANDPWSAPADADIVGLGAVIGFTSTAIIAFLALLIAYFTDSLPEELPQHQLWLSIQQAEGSQYAAFRDTKARHERIKAFKKFMLALSDHINVDYNTGKPDEGAPGTILKKLQKDRRVDQGSKWSPIFGRYGFLAQKPGDEGVTEARLEVGDTVTVVKRNAERTRFQWPKLSTDN